MKQRIFSWLLVLVMLIGILPISALAATTYKVGNNVAIPNSNVPADGSNPYCQCNIALGSYGHWCCWEYSKNAHYYIWGVYPKRTETSTHYLRNLSASERTLTVDHLRNFLRNAVPGALLRIDVSSDPVASDKNGHSLIFVEMIPDGSGAVFLEANYDSRGSSRLAEVPFQYLIDTYGPGTSRNYQYIKYICWPDAPAYVPCNHSYKKVTTVAPTCTGDGYTTYTCQCGDTYHADIVPKLNHEMGTWSITVEPTATENGQKRRDCTRCDYFETETIPSLEATLAITANPKNVKAAVGETAIFNVTATGIGLKYQWQWRKNSSSTWADSTVTGNKTASIQVPVTLANNGYQYCCKITDASGKIIRSTAAVLTVKSNLSITSQPKSVTAVVGETVTFKVTATGDELQYQWQWRKNSSSTWAASSASGNKTATITVPATTGRNGYQYRCVITDALGVKLISNAVVLTVKSGPTITSQPVSVTAKVGETAKFTVAATGTNLTYQWQYKNPSVGTWYSTEMTGNKTSTLQVGAIAFRNGFQYRCKITDSNGIVVYSNAATLTVKSGPSITTQPTSTYLKTGSTANFKVVATGTGLTYQWQYKDPAVGTWYNSGMTGNKTANLQVGAIVARHNFQYRCKITDGNGNVVYSNAATLTVFGIKTQPASATAKLNENVNFKVSAVGNGLTYQWQYKNPSVGTWYSTEMTGNKTATLQVGAIAFRNGFQYRCKITDSKGNVIYTNAATLTVKSGPSITTQPTSTYLKTGNTAKFKVVATGTNLTYQWQYKDPAVGTWYSSTLTGNKTSTIQVGATVGRNNFQYRCKITDGSGNVVYSNAATLTVFGIKTQPSSATAKLNENVNFKVSAVGNGLTYQWQYMNPSVGKWYNSEMTGSKTSTMKVEAIAFRNNFQYRCKITDSKGNVIYTNAVKLTVK